MNTQTSTNKVTHQLFLLSHEDMRPHIPLVFFNTSVDKANTQCMMTTSDGQMQRCSRAQRKKRRSKSNFRAEKDCFETILYFSFQYVLSHLLGSPFHHTKMQFLFYFPHCSFSLSLSVAHSFSIAPPSSSFSR